MSFGTHMPYFLEKNTGGKIDIATVWKAEILSSRVIVFSFSLFDESVGVGIRLFWCNPLNSYLGKIYQIRIRFLFISCVNKKRERRRRRRGGGKSERKKAKKDVHKTTSAPIVAWKCVTSRPFFLIMTDRQTDTSGGYTCKKKEIEIERKIF